MLKFKRTDAIRIPAKKWLSKRQFTDWYSPETLAGMACPFRMSRLNQPLS